jgi:hypothetical protein
VPVQRKVMLFLSNYVLNSFLMLRKQRTAPWIGTLMQKQAGVRRAPRARFSCGC